MIRRIVFGLFVCSLVAGQASAQNWSFDARKVATRLAGRRREPRDTNDRGGERLPRVVLPFGLFQVFRDFDKLNPTNDQFDLIRTMEYAASPLHYTFGRDGTPGHSGSSGLNNSSMDIRNAQLSRDLNSLPRVRARQPAACRRARGAELGKTIKIKRGPGGAFQGVYVGAGPYLSMQRTFDFDPQLIESSSSRPISIVPEYSDASWPAQHRGRWRWR